MNFKQHLAIITGLAAFTALMTFGTVNAQMSTDNLLSITYVQFGGSGDSTLIQLPDGTNILIDAGDRFNSRYQELKSVLEQNNITTIHLAIATHKDSDHLGGFNHLLKMWIIL